jgi:hypothetical protein
MQRISTTVAIVAAATAALAAPTAGQHAGASPQHPTHVITVLADGGSIELRAGTADAEQIMHVQQHLQQLTEALGTGQLDSPAAAHLMCVPGAADIAAKRASITYLYTELPAGAELRMATADPQALGAIHDFLTHHAEHHGAEGQHHGAGHGAAHGAGHGGAGHGAVHGAGHGGAGHGAAHGAAGGDGMHACMPHSADHTGRRQH